MQRGGVQRNANRVCAEALEVNKGILLFLLCLQITRQKNKDGDFPSYGTRGFTSEAVVTKGGGKTQGKINTIKAELELS